MLLGGHYVAALAAAGNPMVLATAALSSVSQTNASTTSSTFADVNASLSVTFDAPSSGVVYIMLSGVVETQNNTVYALWNLRDGGGDVTGTAQMAALLDDNAASDCRVTALMKVSGLTPSSSYTYKWGFANDDNSSWTRILYGGTHGDATMCVIDGDKVLGEVYYNPGTQANPSVTSTSFAAMDTTNLRLTYTAPASGNVVYMLNHCIDHSLNNQPVFGCLKDTGGTTIADTRYNAGRMDETDVFRAFAMLYETGTSGSTTRDFSAAVLSGTGYTRCGGSIYGAFVMLAFDADDFLALDVYYPSQTWNNATTTSLVDVDATNLTVTFDSPPSGSVVGIVAAKANCANTNELGWGIKDASTTIFEQMVQTPDEADEYSTCAMSPVDSLTGSKTWYFGSQRISGTGNAITQYGGDGSDTPSLTTCHGAAVIAIMEVAS